MSAGRKPGPARAWGITRKQAHRLGGTEYLLTLGDDARQVLINSLKWKSNRPRVVRQREYKRDYRLLRDYEPVLADVERMMALAARKPVASVRTESAKEASA